MLKSFEANSDFSENYKNDFLVELTKTLEDFQFRGLDSGENLSKFEVFGLELKHFESTAFFESSCEFSE